MNTSSKIKNSCDLLTKKTDEWAWDVILNIEYKTHPKYGQAYLEQPERIIYGEAISALRRNRNTEHYVIRTLIVLLELARKNERDLRDWLYNEPRRTAQKFIGKKNIREFIFKRDGYKCLCCGTSQKLSLDHIIPIHRGGENKLSNLQTLCSSCNSAKGIAIIDFRNG